MGWMSWISAPQVLSSPYFVSVPSGSSWKSACSSSSPSNASRNSMSEEMAVVITTTHLPLCAPSARRCAGSEVDVDVVDVEVEVQPVVHVVAVERVVVAGVARVVGEGVVVALVVRPVDVHVLGGVQRVADVV